MNRLTNEEVQERIDKNFIQKVSLISDYINKRSKIILRCEECQYTWSTSAGQIIRPIKHYCPNCGIAKKLITKCLYCGKELVRVPSDVSKSKSGNFYCSHSCKAAYENSLKIQKGVYGSYDDLKNYRKKAFDNYEHKCIVCGWNEDERVLEVHHKDENRDNNKLSNLCILCPICHKKITLHLYELTEDYKLIPIKTKD